VGYVVEQPAVAAWRGMSEGDMRGHDIVKGDTTVAGSGQDRHDHQGSYNPWTRWALRYSVVQIAQDAPERSC